MNRMTGLLAGLGVLLVAVLFYFFVWQPKSEEITTIEEQIATVEQQQVQLRNQITELQEVRANAPAIEADIVAAEAVVPRDLGQAAAIRQLQLAADGSGVDLPNVSFGEPVQIVDAPPGLASLPVNVTVDGGYYQIVDFFRRVEDPAISPRGFTWASVSLAPADYPTLSSSASGSIYALLPTPPEPEPEPAPPPTDGETPVPAEDEVVQEDAG